MKAAIHPTYFPDAQVVCACGNVFATGATREKIEVELCYACHPFYTGQMKFVDTAGRVDAFKNRVQKASTKVLSKADKMKLKRQKRIDRDEDRPENLAELRKN